MTKIATLTLLLAVTVLPAEIAAQAPVHRVNGGFPRVSPDGSRILFTSQRSGRSQIYLMNSDGSGIRQLTRDATIAHSPAWSPDGRRIMFMSRQGDTNRIALMNDDGTNALVASQVAGDGTPSWSPDGSKILFAAGTFPQGNIHTMRADGSERTNISPNPGLDYGPVWSPDGHRIAFVAGVRGRGPRVWIMNADGTGRRELSRSDGAQEMPAWSPDSRWVAFQSAIRADPQGPFTESYIVVIDVETGTERRLGTHEHPSFDETPSWFPDGKRLAIQRRQSGDWNVFVIDLNGRVLRQLTR